jgi:hypothetical protein
LQVLSARGSSLMVTLVAPQPATETGMSELNLLKNMNALSVKNETLSSLLLFI